MLQAFTGEGGAACGCTDDKTTSHLVSCCPEGIAGALETEHRVEDVQRNHRLTVGGIGRRCSGEGSDRTSFGNALMHDLTISCLAVAEHQVMVNRNEGISEAGARSEEHTSELQSRFDL